MKNRLTKREQARYDRIVRETVQLLKLGEWDINIIFVDESEIHADGKGGESAKDADSITFGFSWWDPDVTKAILWILWPSIHRREGEMWEDTLIHELVHVRLGGHEAPKGWDLATERNVNIVTSLIRKILGV